MNTQKGNGFVALIILIALVAGFVSLIVSVASDSAEVQAVNAVRESNLINEKLRDSVPHVPVP